MRGVDATTVLAKVIDMHAIFDRTLEVFVKNTMREKRHFFDCCFSVTVVTYRSVPQPAIAARVDVHDQHPVNGVLWAAHYLAPALFSRYQLLATDPALPSIEVNADIPGLMALADARDISAWLVWFTPWAR